MDHTPGFLAIVADAKTRVNEIDIERYRAILQSGQKHLLVDVREDNEWAAAHAKGAHVAVHLRAGDQGR